MRRRIAVPLRSNQVSTKESVHAVSIPVVTEFERFESDSFADIEALLEGRVFHVTKREHWSAIQKSGALLPNQNNSFASSFGSSINSFFRNCGCVSVFDYRVPPDDVIIKFRRQCNPFQPATPENAGIAILVLSPRVHESLLPWSLWKERKAFGEMVVPYVEAGHPGPIPLELVENVFLLRVAENPSSLAGLLRRKRRSKTVG